MKKNHFNTKRILSVVLFILSAAVLTAGAILIAPFFQDEPEIHTPEMPPIPLEIEEPVLTPTGTPLETTMQEIDGRTIAVRQQLPIEQPALLPSEANDVSITVNKKERVLLLYNSGELIAKYSIGLGSVPEGAKEQEGDKRTPEGNYEVCVLNGASKYYLALGLNYPNRIDAKRGLDSGLITQAEYDDIIHSLDAGETPNWYTKLGGMIMIHGQKGALGGQCDWTTGCVAVDNVVMDILWKYCKVGTPVTILP